MKCLFVNSVWCSNYDYMSAAGLFSDLQWRTWGDRVAKCWLVAAGETVHSQRAQVAGSLGLRSSASHSQCVEMWRWRWGQATRHHSEEQAAARANYWSQQIKEVYPDNVSGYSRRSISLMNIPLLVFVKWKHFKHSKLVSKHRSGIYTGYIFISSKGKYENVNKHKSKIKVSERANQKRFVLERELKDKWIQCNKNMERCS